jgi:hypothetical protein
MPLEMARQGRLRETGRRTACRDTARPVEVLSLARVMCRPVHRE